MAGAARTSVGRGYSHQPRRATRGNHGRSHRRLSARRKTTKNEEEKDAYEMKALSMTQPWASAFLTNRKKIETRSWGRASGLFDAYLLAIHAAKGWSKLDQELAARLCPDLPMHRGSVIGVVYLVRCFKMTEEFCATVSAEEESWGNFAPGRWAWQRHEKVLVLPDPIPVKGNRMLWNWYPPEEVAKLCAEYLDSIRRGT